MDALHVEGYFPSSFFLLRFYNVKFSFLFHADRIDINNPVIREWRHVKTSLQLFYPALPNPIHVHIRIVSKTHSIKPLLC
jgi:hypothetical protein